MAAINNYKALMLMGIVSYTTGSGGIPGVDYPILAKVPDTGFLCKDHRPYYLSSEDQEFTGYFVDPAAIAGCQVYHHCQEDFRLDSFLCPNKTIFNQQTLGCDWWYNVDCASNSGIPGVDYPALASVPDTEFLCEDHKFTGTFADTTAIAGCQVYHICYEDFHSVSFLCPNETIFNQQTLECDWWFNVDCAASSDFYVVQQEEA